MCGALTAMDLTLVNIFLESVYDDQSTRCHVCDDIFIPLWFLRKKHNKTN